MKKRTKLALEKRNVLTDIYGDYLRCHGKRVVQSRRTALKVYTRICGQPSTIHCEYCGEPLCNKCDTTFKRHKTFCEWNYRIKKR